MREINIRETNMNKIKQIAKNFLHFEIAKTDLPFIVQHPFTNSPYVMVKKGKNRFELGDLSKKEDLKLWTKNLEREIDNFDLFTLLIFMNKAFYLLFIKNIEPYLSDGDLGKVLAQTWTSIEYISTDINVSSEDITNWFKRADKKTLMSVNELEILESLPQKVTIYRGVTAENNMNHQALSWTLNRDTAKWFANRFQTGTCEIWQKEIKKEEILCYFGGRNESEVIVDILGGK